MIKNPWTILEICIIALIMAFLYDLFVLRGVGVRGPRG